MQAQARYQIFLTKGPSRADPLRIGLYTECFRPVRNGIVTSIESLVLAARAGGHVVRVVAPATPGFVDPDSDVVRLPSLPLPTRTGYRLPLSGGPPVELDVLHAHSLFLTGALAVRGARRRRVPLVFTYHTRLEAYAHYVPLAPRLTRALAAALTRRFASAADVIVVPTLAMRARLRTLGVGRRIVVIPSGIDVAAFEAGRRRPGVRARLGAAGDVPLVLAVGRLGREKNLELVLRAFAALALPAARLAIVGDGTHGGALRRLAKRLGVAERTTFVPSVERAALPDLYASADVFAFASASETQGLVLAEALAAGLAVVAVDGPVTREILGGAGRLVAGRPEAFARALRETLARPPDPAAGRAVARGFEGGLSAARVLALYAELVARRRRRA